MSQTTLTRRELVKGSAALLAGCATLGPVQALALPKSRVVLVRDREVFDSSGQLRGAVLARMLDQAAARLFGTDPARAWRRVVGPKDTVGIKSNAWAHLPTPAVLEQQIRERVLAAGVAKGRVAVDDRGVLRNPVFQRATALINVRPLRTHHWSGVGSLIKNYIMFVPDPPRYHPDSCADLGAIWRLPLVAGKTRLCILVMLSPLFYGVGPHHYDPQYVWRYSGLLVGTDPVAVDTVGLRILLAKRRQHFGEERRTRPPPKHIAIAGERHRLGVSDPSRIEIVRLGWSEGTLI